MLPSFGEHMSVEFIHCFRAQLSTAQYAKNRLKRVKIARRNILGGKRELGGTEKGKFWKDISGATDARSLWQKRRLWWWGGRDKQVKEENMDSSTEKNTLKNHRGSKALKVREYRIDINRNHQKKQKHNGQADCWLGQQWWTEATILPILSFLRISLWCQQQKVYMHVMLFHKCLHQNKENG